MKVYQELAHAIQAYHNCITHGNHEWKGKWLDKIEHIETEYLPRGSGFDAGSKIHVDSSTGEHVVITTSFHHMDEFGGYVGWSEWKIEVLGSLLFGLRFEITKTYDGSHVPMLDEDGEPMMDEDGNLLVFSLAEVDTDGYIGDVFNQILQEEYDPNR